MDSKSIHSTIDPRGLRGVKKSDFFMNLSAPPPIAYLVDNGASFDTPGVPGSGSIVEIQEL